MAVSKDTLLLVFAAILEGMEDSILRLRSRTKAMLQKGDSFEQMAVHLNQEYASSMQAVTAAAYAKYHVTEAPLDAAAVQYERDPTFMRMKERMTTLQSWLQSELQRGLHG